MWLSRYPHGGSLFFQGLKTAGFVDGQNIRLEYRFAEGRDDHLPSLVNELVSREVAVIVCYDAPAAFAAKLATKRIPIVFLTGADPVKLGLVDKLQPPRQQPHGGKYFG